jgi:hypothetical protein
MNADIATKKLPTKLVDANFSVGRMNVMAFTRFGFEKTRFGFRDIVSSDAVV